MPTREGKRYQKPYGQSLFTKQAKVIDVFNTKELCDQDELEVLGPTGFGTSRFSVHRLLNYHLQSERRYPT